MSEFTFTSSAECSLCGAYLSSSDEECDHDGKEVNKHLFRRLSEGRESLTGVRCTSGHKWYALEDRVGDDWIAYEYLGTKSTVNVMLDGGKWDSVEDLPKVSMSVNAPNDVGEESE